MAPLGKKKKAKAKASPPPKKAEPEVCPAQVPLPAERSIEESSPPRDDSEKTETPNQSSQSWYNRTWPRKAAPVTQIARESISSASNVVSETASNIRSSSKTSSKSSRSPSLQLTKKPSRAAPAGAATTMVNAVSGSSTASLPTGDTETASGEPDTESAGPNNNSKALGDESAQESKSASIKQPIASSETPADSTDNSSSTSTRWLGWLSRSGMEMKNTDSTRSNIETSGSAGPAGREEQQQPMQDISSSQPDAVHRTDLKNLNEKGKQQGNDISTNQHDSSQQIATNPSKRSWLQMFGSSSSDAPETNQAQLEHEAPLPEGEPRHTSTTSELPSKGPPAEASPPPDLPGDGKSSGWAFWSRDRKSVSASTQSDPHIGELAISNTPSQKRPKRASISLEKPIGTSPESAKPKHASTTQPPKQNEIRRPTPGSKEVPSKEPTKELAISAPVKAQDIEAASKALQNAVPNQLLPSFQETFLLQESPTLMQQLGRLIGYIKFPEPRHLHAIRDPPRIKNALAIGVHGYFPAPLIRTMLGQPTGTSIKFADMATKAIRKWTASQGYDCEVKSAALEGEGRIGERVALLWKLLLNWIEEIRKSDFILVACHSQGVPVALMLVAKLISFGCVSSAKVGICAMAGVNLGPFPDYKSRWISGSAGELFEFSNRNSTVSKDLFASLRTCLEFGVRITFVGSIDDQLVSLEVRL